MSLRSRITKVAIAAVATGALLVGAPMAANASSYPVFHQVLKMKSTGHKFDIVSGPTSNTRANFKFGLYSYGTYKYWSFKMVDVQNHKRVIVTVKGTAYLNNYVTYNLENPKTYAPYTTYSSATALKNFLVKGSKMSEAQLKAFAKTHIG